MAKTRDNITTGTAGVFHVAAALSIRGIIVTLTLRNARGIDLFASDGSKSVMIQVKTSSRKKREWQLDKKIETENSPDLLFLFVDLGHIDEIPDFYIVPSGIVADYCKSKTADWINATSGEQKQKREKLAMRKFRDKENKYLNRWDFLGLKIK